MKDSGRNDSNSPPSGIAPPDNRFYQTISDIVMRHVPGAAVFPLLMAGARTAGTGASAATRLRLAPFILEREDVGRVHGIDERISIDNLISELDEKIYWQVFADETERHIRRKMFTDSRQPPRS